MTVMASLVIGAVLLLSAFAGSASSRPVDEHVQAELRYVIEVQLEAFRRDDGEKAFAQASPEIRAVFGNAERFMQMVRESYEAVYRPRAYEFEPAISVQGRTAQPVKFIGPDGRGVGALYYMERQEDGSWRIGGVELVPLVEREI